MDRWYAPLVVMSNSKNVLNCKYAPKAIKDKIVRSDNLVKLLKTDIEKTDKDFLWNKKDMNACAFNIMSNYNNEIERDYEQELIDWLEESNKNKKEKVYKTELNQPVKVINVDANYLIEIRKKLVEFRKEKSMSMNVPAYYIFTNDELDKILKLMPIDIEELKKSDILSSIKLKMHGEEIINIINETAEL